MARSVQELEQAVRSLQVAERNRLLRNIISDIDGEPKQDIEQAWLDEAKGRYQELREGIVESVSASQVIQRAKSRLKNES